MAKEPQGFQDYIAKYLDGKRANKFTFAKFYGVDFRLQPSTAGRLQTISEESLESSVVSLPASRPTFGAFMDQLQQEEEE